ncbi:MAG: AAA family ATPase [Alteromonadaceae bacterium]|nr:AAA family ATPase [Alteromonadaceae bacterium]
MRLKDLSNLIDKCRNDYGQLDYKSDIKIDTQLSARLASSLKVVDKSSTHVIQPFSIEFENRNGLRAAVPSSSLWYAHCFWPLSEQLTEYQAVLDEIKDNLKSNSSYTTSDIVNFLKKLPSTQFGSIGSQIELDFKTSISSVLNDPNDQAFFIKYCSEKEWWFKPVRSSEASSGKTLDRSDVSDSSLALACGVVIASNSKMLLIIKAFENSKPLRNYFASKSFVHHDFDDDDLEQHSDEELSSSHTNYNSSNIKGENIIFYGAPGVGKSYKIDQFCTDANSIHTVFHPDTQYTDFVGCLKPSMSGEDIVYAFRPGPFTIAIKLACEKPNEPIILAIEEINRAAAAAVFGELFQLLDRRDDGRSKYSISISDPDMKEYLEKNAPDSLDAGKLCIPANLSIYATMNSSDQAVMPMDTAFKRRWKFEYIPITFLTESGHSNGPSGSIPIPTRSGNNVAVEWTRLAEVINDALESESIPEDRLLGPWFLSSAELDTPESAKKSLKGKLLLYIWDDVLRHGSKSIIFDSGIRTYGSLIRRLNSDEAIFNENIEQELLKHLEETSDLQSKLSQAAVKKSDSAGANDEEIEY